MPRLLASVVAMVISAGRVGEDMLHDNLYVIMETKAEPFNVCKDITGFSTLLDSCGVDYRVAVKSLKIRVPLMSRHFPQQIMVLSG